MKKYIVSICLSLFGILIISNAAYGQGYETKDQWAAKILKDNRISAQLCASSGYLVTCTTAYADEENGKPVQKTIDKASCTESVDYLTKALLHDGKSDGKPAMFYLKLPTNIGAGYQMDYYASELGKQNFGQISQILQQKGGSLMQSPECNQKLMEMLKINGN